MRLKCVREPSVLLKPETSVRSCTSHTLLAGHHRADRLGQAGHVPSDKDPGPSSIHMLHTMFALLKRRPL